jgi:type II secretory pathway pseudopilin PulG
MKNPYTPPSAGFTLLELLIIIVIVVLGSTWAVPQYQRRLALNQLDQYIQQIESGLFSLRARQSAEGTSCEININPSYVGTDNTNGGFGQATEVLELSHLNPKEREERLRCCDATSCSWEPPYRLISKEGTTSSKTVGIKFSQSKYTLSPPGMSADSNSLIILVRSNNEQNDPKRPLAIRCVKLSTAGHLHRGTWEESRCRRR